MKVNPGFSLPPGDMTAFCLFLTLLGIFPQWLAASLSDSYLTHFRCERVPAQIWNVRRFWRKNQDPNHAYSNDCLFTRLSLKSLKVLSVESCVFRNLWDWENIIASLYKNGLLQLLLPCCLTETTLMVLASQISFGSVNCSPRFFYCLSYSSDMNGIIRWMLDITLKWLEELLCLNQRSPLRCTNTAIGCINIHFPNVT